jgi:hypothetical protein
MNKKILISLIILAVIAGGFFYWWFIWELPQEEGEETSQPPTLFAKEDYKIEEREDGKYIVIEKVGLTCKVPEGWEIKIEGDDIPEPEYWVDLYSPDLATTTGNVLVKGCILNIMAQKAEKAHQELVENIKLLEENPEEATELLQKDYVLFDKFKIIKIGDYYGLELVFARENAVMGGSKGINIPFEDYKILSFGIGFPLAYKEICYREWDKFFENIVIE